MDASLWSEDGLRELVGVLVRLVELAGAIVIFAGAAVAIVRFAYRVVRREIAGFVGIRLDMGRFLALGLEFQLASDLLRTAVAPSFDGIAKLAAVAAIRTALNFFLAREIRRERTELDQRGQSLA